MWLFNCILDVGHMYFLNAGHFVCNYNSELIIALRLEQDITNTIVFLQVYFEDGRFIPNDTELLKVDNDKGMITFANEKPVILIENDLLDMSKLVFSLSYLFYYVFWLIIFNVEH